jgi:hypothetical protein
MDYLLFHSQYSPSSKKLLDDFPALREKAVSVDSAAMRSYVKKLHVVCVPTLMVILGNRVVDRIVGYDSISNWLLVSLYRMGQLQGAAVPNDMMAPEEYHTSSPPELDLRSVVEDGVHEDPVMMTAPTSTSTSLDDLILEDIPKAEQQRLEYQETREAPIVQTGMSANTMLLAEQLKKERDNYDPSNKKKFAA